MLRQVQLRGQNNKIHPPKVLQFGGGNFIRGFADWMIDILNKEADFEGSIIVIKPTIKGDYRDLKKQKGAFYTVLSGMKEDQPHQNIRLIESIHSVIHPFNDMASMMESVQEPNIRFIISNTTEAGIVFNDTTVNQPNGDMTFPEMLLEWLYERYICFNGAADKGCIILPLELIENNGQELKKCVMQYAEMWQKEAAFIEWLNNHNYFCNTLVDRIISGFPKNPEPYFQKIGAVDKKMVMGEHYHSWIIEAPEFVASELPFHKTDLNVQFVEDLSIHREIKVKLLNGAHTALAPIGLLAGFDLVSDAIEDETISSFIQMMWREEIFSTIDHPKEELESFITNTHIRFRNASIRHQLISIATQSPAKFVTRLLPTLNAFLSQKEQLPKRIVFALAAILSLYEGERDGKKFKLKDKRSTLSFFKNIWTAFEEDYVNHATTLLDNKSIWTKDMSTINGLTNMLADYLYEIDEKGIIKAIQFLKL